MCVCVLYPKSNTHTNTQTAVFLNFSFRQKMTNISRLQPLQCVSLLVIWILGWYSWQKKSCLALFDYITLTLGPWVKYFVFFTIFPWTLCKVLFFYKISEAFKQVHPMCLEITRDTCLFPPTADWLKAKSSSTFPTGVCGFLHSFCTQTQQTSCFTYVSIQATYTVVWSNIHWDQQSWK